MSTSDPANCSCAHVASDSPVHEAGPVSSKTLKNQKKKQRQKLAKKAKMGLLPAKGKLVSVLPPEGGGRLAGQEAGGSAELVAADGGTGPVVLKGSSPLKETPPEAATPSHSDPQSAKRAARKRKQKTANDADVAEERTAPCSGSKRSKGVVIRAKEKWHSSDVLLNGQAAADAVLPGSERVSGQKPSMAAGQHQNDRHPSLSRLPTRLKKPALPMIPLAVLRLRPAASAPGAAAKPLSPSAGSSAELRGNGKKTVRPSVAGEEVEAASSAVSPESKRSRGTAAAPECEVELQEGKGRKGKAFIYGNYSRYYGYRTFQAFDQDPRLRVLQKEWFAGRRLLDIGCHEGVVTIAMAMRFRPSRTTGLDIDSRLIEKAKWHLKAARNKASERLLVGPDCGGFDNRERYPYAESASDMRSERGREAAGQLTALRATQFTCGPVQDFNVEPGSWDTVTLFSVVKWIHLHVGDDGIRKVFRKLAQGLAPGGVLIVEPQPMKSYRQAFRKQVMPSYVHMFTTLKFLPEHFPEFLQKDCGLQLLHRLTVGNSTKGFDRPIYVLQKSHEGR